jgi:lysophospholipase L1-like esterase
MIEALKKILWFSILTISVLGIIVLSAGFYKAVVITGQASPEEIIPAVEHPDKPNARIASTKKAGTLSLLIMGDSIARGTGDETGKGFSAYLPDYLKNLTPKQVAVTNIGINGLQSKGLQDLLQGGKMNALLADADFVLISIGGNDLSRIRSLDNSAREDAFRERLAGYLASLKDIISGIRKSNNNVLIIFIGLYNPAEMGKSSDDNRLLISWNGSTQQLIEEDGQALFIPTLDLFKFNRRKYIAPDGLHPNSTGYQAISNRIGKSIEGYLNNG